MGAPSGAPICLSGDILICMKYLDIAMYVFLGIAILAAIVGFFAG